jgi:hypothetical protein
MCLPVLQDPQALQCVSCCCGQVLTEPHLSGNQLQEPISGPVQHLGWPIDCVVQQTGQGLAAVGPALLSSTSASRGPVTPDLIRHPAAKQARTTLSDGRKDAFML